MWAISLRSCKSPSVTRNPAASSKSLPGVRMVTATLTGSWWRPRTWIAIGSSVARRSGRSEPLPAPARRHHSDLGRRMTRGRTNLVCQFSRRPRAPRRRLVHGRESTDGPVSQHARPLFQQRLHRLAVSHGDNGDRHDRREATGDLDGCQRLAEDDHRGQAATIGLLDPITEETEAST